MASIDTAPSLVPRSQKTSKIGVSYKFLLRAANGKAGRPAVFVEGVAHIPDGLAFDAEGFLYVSCFGDSRIWRVSPRGKKTLLADDPSSLVINRATNVAFGGPGRRTLYVANLGGWHISRMKLTVAGQPLAGS